IPSEPIPAILEPSEPIISAIVVPSEPIPSIIERSSEPMPSAMTIPSESIASIIERPSEHMPSAIPSGPISAISKPSVQPASVRPSVAHHAAKDKTTEKKSKLHKNQIQTLHRRTVNKGSYLEYNLLIV